MSLNWKKWTKQVIFLKREAFVRVKGQNAGEIAALHKHIEIF